MQGTKRHTAKTEKAHRADPRFVAFARLLARAAARRDSQEQLSRSQAEGYACDERSGEVKDDLARIAARREELQALLTDTKEEPVLLHPNMATYYREQVAALAEALNAEENRAEAADLLRALIERIELTPNADGKLEIDLHGDLAGILSLAANNRKGPLDESDPSVQQ